MTDFRLIAFLAAIGLLLGVMLSLEIGRRLGVKHAKTEGATEGTGPLEAAIFGLLGLLIAFTFSGAVSRFDDRQHLIVEEANDIGTAYLRVDLLPPGSQPAIRDKFKQYVDSRLETYRKIPDMEAVNAELKRSQQLQSDIWTMSVAASQNSPTTMAGMLLMPALNAMIDITTTRTMSSQMHPPMPIFIMLVVIALASAVLAGFGMARAKSKNWLHKAGFALILSLTVYVILDMEYPRLGFIRVDSFDQALVDVRNSM
jgi:hypothetical protein